MIYIYKGPGTSPTGIEYLKKLFSKQSIYLISPEEVLKGEWACDAELFVMPGGADIPYAEKLNGQGNAVIRKYVENGGYYLGICAGAYYAGKYLEFAKGTDLEVVGNRELAFFPGTIQGPTFPPYYYDSYKGATTALVEWNMGGQKISTPIFYNGGGYFTNTENYSDVVVLGTYADLSNQPAVVIECAVGKGKAILSGVHFEYDSTLLDVTDPHLRDLIPILEKHEQEKTKLVRGLMKKAFHFTLS